jgi:hypothetical protein
MWIIWIIWVKAKRNRQLARSRFFSRNFDLDHLVGRHDPDVPDDPDRVLRVLGGIGPDVDRAETHSGVQ